MLNLFFYTVILKLLISPLVTGYNESSFYINEFILFFPDIILINISVLLYIKETDRSKNFLSRLILFQVIFVIISNLINDIGLIKSLQNLVRTLLPISLIYFLCFQKKIILHKKLIKLAIGLIFIISILNIYAFINFSPEYNRVIKFLPSYFGGVHTSTYILLSTYFLLFTIYQTSHKSLQFKFFLTIYTIFCLYMIIYGWGVRTIFLSFLLFYILYYLSTKNIKNPFSNFLIIIFIIIFLTITLVEFNIIFIENIDLLASGRLSMYDQKILLIKNFTITEFSFGKGFGSDLILTDVWWWGSKGSHNDFITIFFENGILFFILFVITLKKIYSLFETNLTKIFFLTIIFTSLISNGFIVRPMAMYVMVLVFLIANNYKKINRNA
jgi:hypothetical protein